MVDGIVPASPHNGYVLFDELLFLLEFSFDDAVERRRSTGYNEPFAQKPVFYGLL